MAAPYPDRVDVYRVSYVIWNRRPDGDERHRTLREDWTAGASTAEAAARARAWGERIAYPEDGWAFERVDVVAVTFLFTMERCATCRAFPGPEWSGVRCLCDGVVCAACGRRSIWRPISELYEEESGHFFHVSWLQGMRKICPECCRAREEQHKRRRLP